jgi:hypothetical protein
MSHGGIHDSRRLWMPRGYPLVLTTLFLAAMSRFDDEDTRVLGIMAVLGVFGLELEEEEVGVTRADDPSLGGLFEIYRWLYGLMKPVLTWIPFLIP